MSHQGTLDLFAPAVRPVSESWQEHAPIAPSADLTAKHCSSMGALTAEESRETIWERMLALYRSYPRTDAEIAEMLRIQRSTVNARRAELIAMGKVESAKRTRKNPRTGVSNSLWQLAEKR